MSAKIDTQLKDFGSIFSLEGKVAVVTGGSRGLGLHAASGYVEFLSTDLSYIAALSFLILTIHTQLNMLSHAILFFVLR